MARKQRIVSSVLGLVLFLAGIFFFFPRLDEALAAGIITPHHTKEAGGLTANGSMLYGKESGEENPEYTILIQAPDEENPFPGQCVNITNNSKKNYFVPWQTPKEWSAFQKAVNASKLPGSPMYGVYLSKCCSHQTLKEALERNNIPGQEDGKICGIEVPLKYPGDRWLGLPVVAEENKDSPHGGADGDLYTIRAEELFPSESMSFTVTLVCKDGEWVQVNSGSGSCEPVNGACSLDAFDTVKNPTPTGGFATIPGVTSLCAPGSLLHNDEINSNDKGWWIWQCDGTKGMTNASCHALNTTSSATCGVANGASGFYSQPSDEELCAIGVPSSITTKGGSLWTWTCFDAASNTKVTTCATIDPSKPTCNPTYTGTSKYIYSVPEDSLLCSSGSVTTKNFGMSLAEWSWYCGGTGYSDAFVKCVVKNGNYPATCNATYQGKITTATLTESTANLCSFGTASNFVETDIGWTWRCTSLNGDRFVPCNTSSSSKVAQCGTATGKTQKSTTLEGTLCAYGNPIYGPEKVVRPDGKTVYRWKCEPTAGGDSLECEANSSDTVATCGSANGKTYSAMPDSGLLCSYGTAINMTGSGPWTWECKSIDQTATSAKCIAYSTGALASCGTANGSTFSSAPTTNLCAKGSASPVSGSEMGPWSWSCTSTDGSLTVSCAAKTTAALATCGLSNGAALTTAPTTNLCQNGIATSVTGSGPWIWDCLSMNGEKTASCSASVAEPMMDGICGPANGSWNFQAPNAQLCASGTATTVSGSGPWTWVCKGISGGADSPTCSASVCTACTGSSEEEKTQSVSISGNACTVTGTRYWTQRYDLVGRVLTSQVSLGWQDDILGYRTFSASQPSVAEPVCQPCTKQLSVSDARTVVSENACGVSPGTYPAQTAVLE